MIDLHNHILPGLDDGAADLDESVDIARRFVAEGVRVIAATPHFNPERDSHGPYPGIGERVRIVQAAIEDARLNLTVLPGNEIFLTPDVPRLVREGAALPLGSSNAVLVECAFDHRPVFLDDTLFQLQLHGYQPVLAHPERYQFVERDPLSVRNLVERGVVLQLTAASLLGHYGAGVRKTAETLLFHGMYAAAASDRHHPDQARSLVDLHAHIRRLVGQQVADLLLRENPRRLLESKAVSEAPTATVPSRSPFSRLFSRRQNRQEPE